MDGSECCAVCGDVLDEHSPTGACAVEGCFCACFESAIDEED